MRIAVAISGGVDSSVAALLLKEKGYDVLALTIKTWPKEECGAGEEKMCCSLEAVQSARSIAEDLGIPHHVIDLSKEFAKEVKSYFISEYSKGRTPNPCIYCNSKIKFGYLFSKAKELGARKIATGHYSRIIEKNNKYYLAEARDTQKDQSYFLYDIPKEALEFIEFPLGELAKEKVRAIAEKNNLTSANRKASQDICFATNGGDYRDYLEKSGVSVFTPGDILDTSGRVIGRHKGIASYTVGQRKGIGLAMPEPVYVLKIDPEKNTITVGVRSHAMNKRLRVAGFNWLTLEKLKKPQTFATRILYNGKKAEALVTPIEKEEAIVEFSEPQFAPTPGQAAVFYDGEIVAGGAWIEEVIA